MIFLKKKTPTEYTREQNKIIQDYEYLNSNAQEGKTVIIGDEYALRFPCAEMMPFRVYNRGIEGDSVKLLLKRIENNCMSVDPRSIVLAIGTNDLAFGVSPLEIKNKVAEIIDTIKNINEKANIYILSLLPTEKIKNALSLTTETNNYLLEFAKQTKLVRFVDVTQALSDNNGKVKTVFLDGDLPNVHAYSVIAKKLLDAMNYNAIQQNTKVKK